MKVWVTVSHLGYGLENIEVGEYDCKPVFEQTRDGKIEMTAEQHAADKIRRKLAVQMYQAPVTITKKLEREAVHTR